MAEIHDERPDRWLVLEMVVEEASGYHARFAGCVALSRKTLKVPTPPGPSLLCRQLSGLAALVRPGALCCSPRGGYHCRPCVRPPGTA